MIVINYIQIILSHLCIAFLAVYYCIIDTSHVGNMDWWAIILLVGSTINIFIACTMLGKNDRKQKRSKLESVLCHVSLLPFYILTLPVFLIVFLISIPLSILSSRYILSKPLRKKGFKFSRKSKENRVFLTKGETVIMLAHKTYMISFDGTKNYTDIADCDLGSDEERSVLKEKVLRYINASSLDIQRGDVSEPISDIIIFLDKHLN